MTKVKNIQVYYTLHGFVKFDLFHCSPEHSLEVNVSQFPFQSIESIVFYFLFFDL